MTATQWLEGSNEPVSDVYPWQQCDHQKTLYYTQVATMSLDPGKRKVPAKKVVTSKSDSQQKDVTPPTSSRPDKPPQQVVVHKTIYAYNFILQNFGGTKVLLVCQIFQI